jgi:iron-sulfur cluster repair protein YtfE (RIC family)
MVVAEAQAPPELLSSVMDYLAWDHDRLDALCQQAFEARGRGALEEAERCFREFARGLRRHIGLEEELLFPEFEQLTGMTPDAGPTAVMRHEHRQIESFLLTLERVIGVPGAEAEQAEQSLARVLVDHNAKEEQILYPTTDRLLSGSERRDLVERLCAYGRQHPAQLRP